jgi:hypothetical protein
MGIFPPNRCRETLAQLSTMLLGAEGEWLTCRSRKASHWGRTRMAVWSS